MKKKLIFISISLLVIFVLILLNISVANPTSGVFYSLKRLYEKTQINLKQTPKEKLDYQYILLDKRLSELTYIVENGVSQGILTSSLRYSTTAGQITDIIIQNNFKDEAKKARGKFAIHYAIVKNLLQKYSGNASEMKFITDDLNYLTIYIKLLSEFENGQK
jgi:hypothetical protein